MTVTHKTTKPTTTATKAEPQDYEVKVTRPLVNIRHQPNPSADIARQASLGDVLTAIEAARGWTKLQDGTYVLTSLVTRC